MSFDPWNAHCPGSAKNDPISRDSFMLRSSVLLAVWLLTVSPPAMGHQTLDASSKLTILTTPEEIRYGLVGNHDTTPAPTLFVFAGGIETSLTHPIYSQACNILRKKGALCVSLDLPCHGKDIRPGEPEGLKGWRHRVDQGEDPMEDLVARASSVLDSLIAEGLSDPKHVLASGTSRGGYAAMQLAAHDQRVGSVAAFAPVTDLRALSEFDGFKKGALARPLGLIEYADKLAGRNLWLIIGDRDNRVSTQHTVDLALEVSRRSAQKALTTRVELHLEPTEGHQVPEGAYQRAAKWLLDQAGIE